MESILESFAKASADVAVRNAYILEAARRLLRVGDSVKSGRTLYTLTQCGPDRFWLSSNQKRAVAESSALTELGTPYVELIASRGGYVGRVAFGGVLFS